MAAHVMQLKHLTEGYDSQWTVKGDNGTRHKVSKAGRAWSCSCPAWKFKSPRRDCKHIVRIKLTERR